MLEMRAAATVCEEAGGSSQASQFSNRAARVKDEANAARIALEKYKTELTDQTQQWTTANKLRDELLSWVDERLVEIRQCEARPAKLHLEAAALEMSQLEVSGRVITRRNLGGWDFGVLH